MTKEEYEKLREEEEKERQNAVTLEELNDGSGRGAGYNQNTAISVADRVRYGLTGEGYNDKTVAAFKAAKRAGADKASTLESVQNAMGYNDRDDITWYRKSEQQTGNDAEYNNLTKKEKKKADAEASGTENTKTTGSAAARATTDTNIAKLADNYGMTVDQFKNYLAGQSITVQKPAGQTAIAKLQKATDKQTTADKAAMKAASQPNVKPTLTSDEAARLLMDDMLRADKAAGSTARTKGQTTTDRNLAKLADNYGMTVDEVTRYLTNGNTVSAKQQAQRYKDISAAAEADKNAGGQRSEAIAEYEKALSAAQTAAQRHDAQNAAKQADEAFDYKAFFKNPDAYINPSYSGTEAFYRRAGKSASGGSSNYGGYGSPESVRAYINSRAPTFGENQKGVLEFEGVKYGTPEYLKRVAGYTGGNLLAGVGQVAEGIGDKVGTDLSGIYEYGLKNGGVKSGQSAYAPNSTGEQLLANNLMGNYANALTERYKPTEETQKKGGAEYAQQIGNMVALSLMTYGANALAGAAAPGIMGYQTAAEAAANGVLGTVTPGVGAAMTGTDIGMKIAQMTPQFAAIYTAAAGQAAQEAYRQGATYEQAVKYGKLNGIVEASVETLSGGIPGMNKGVVTEALERAIAATPGASLAIDLMGEGAEDVIGDIIDPYIKRLTYDPTAKNATVGELAQTFLNSSAMAAIMQGLTVGRNIAAQNGADTTAIDSNLLAQGINVDQTAQPRVSTQTIDERMNEALSTNPQMVQQPLSTQNYTGVVTDQTAQQLTAARQALENVMNDPASTSADIRAAATNVDAALQNYETAQSAKTGAVTNVQQDVTAPVATGVPEVLNAGQSNSVLEQNRAGTGAQTLAENPVQQAQNSSFGAQTVGAAEMNPQSYAHLQNQYGVMDASTTGVRDAGVPLRSADGRVVNQFARNALENTVTEEAVIPLLEEAVAKGDMSHDVITDNSAMEYAKKTLSENGISGSETMLKNVYDSGTLWSKGQTAVAEALYTQLNREAAYNADPALRQEAAARATALAVEMAVDSSKKGQDLQAYSMLKKCTPDGRVLYTEKVIEAARNELTNKLFLKKGHGAKVVSEIDWSIPAELRQKMLEAKTVDQMDAVQKEIGDVIAKRIPPSAYTFGEKLANFRYLSMLCNPATWARNFIGNVAMRGEVAMKDIVKIPLEAVAKSIDPNYEKTSAFILDPEMQAFAKDSIGVIRNVMQGSKFNETGSQILQNSNIYGKYNPLRYAQKVTDWSMEKGDFLFSDNLFTNSLAQYLTANGVTKADIDSGTANAIVQRAEAYAIQEAQKGTFRDASALANLLSNAGRNAENYLTRNGKNVTDAHTTGAILQGAIDGLLAFKRTPIDVAKRALEYSPVGIVTGTAQTAMQVATGHLDAQSAVDRIASGLTGTGVFALGVFLARAGILSGGFGDNKEDDFEKLQGRQEYALTIGDSSYTLSWMAPANVALFMGVQYAKEMDKIGGDSWYESMCKAFTSGSTWESVLDNTTAPLTQMTMLDNLYTALKNVKTSEGGMLDVFKEGLTDYLSQFNPTLLGAIARTVDPTQRNTYYNDKTDNIPDWMQVFVQRNMARIPGVSQQLPENVDAWGRTKENTMAPLERLAYNVMSPGYYSEANTTEVDKELQRLYDELGDTSVFPTVMAKNYKFDGVKTDLSASDYVTGQKVLGQTAFDELQKLFASESYKSMTEDEKAKAVDDVYAFAKMAAKAAVSEDYAASDGYKKQKALTDAGVGAALSAEINAKYREINAQDGVSAAQKATEFSQWLDKQGLTETQRTAMDEAKKFYFSGPADPTPYDAESFAKYSDEDTLDRYSGTGLNDEGQYELWSKYLSQVGKDKTYDSKASAIEAMIDSGEYTEPEAYAYYNIARETYSPTDNQKKNIDAYLAATGDEEADAYLAAAAVKGLYSNGATQSLAAEIIRTLPALSALDDPEKFISYYFK